MSLSPLTLLKDRDAFWRSAKTASFRWVDILPLLAFILLACAVYGAILAGWRSWSLSLYVAIKLPLLFLSTTALVAVFNWMLATLLGSGLNFKATVFIVCASMTIAGWLLLAMAPISLFFVLSGVPSLGSHDELRYAHNCILMTHILVLAIAGMAGNLALYRGLRALVTNRCPVGLLFLFWLIAFAFVGCQTGWILRPFVGSPFYPIVFLRPDALDRNFYEFVFTEVIPYLLGGGR